MLTNGYRTSGVNEVNIVRCNCTCQCVRIDIDMLAEYLFNEVKVYLLRSHKFTLMASSFHHGRLM